MKIKLIGFITLIVFLCSCKKESVKSEQLEAANLLASKYNLSLKVGYNKDSVKRNFATLNDFEKFLKSTINTVKSDSAFIKTNKIVKSNISKSSAAQSALSNNGKKLAVDDSDWEDGIMFAGEPYHEYTFRFAQLKDLSFPSLAIAGISNAERYKLEVLNIYLDGVNAGSSTYQTTQILSNGSGYTLNATAHGNYVETYSVNGIFTYSIVWRSTFVVSYDRSSAGDGSMRAKLTYDKVSN